MRCLIPKLLTILAVATIALPAPAPAPEYKEFERKHWSLQPRLSPAVPAFTDPSDQAWVRTPVDAFILQKLKENELQPAPEAGRAVLLRRVTLDLTGLPPTPAELADFLGDRSPEAFETAVDRLLASAAYGERWAQHWLDVVRFAETEGFEYDRYLPGLWRYRDYVIASLNKDKPFNEFLREQLAGDEMVEGDPLERRNQELLIAAGFHRLGAVRRNAGNQEVASSRNEVLTERTDIVGSAFLGLTVGCARCHDHMFDPIRQADYYRLQAYLAATQESDIPIEGDMTPADWRDKTKELSSELKKLRGKIELASNEEQVEIRAKMAKLQAQLPEPPPTLSTIKNDYEEFEPIHILARGDHTKPGEPVDMRPLGVLLPDGEPTIPAKTPSPRTMLANWLADPDHPLTARVMVNRIWGGHFGVGFVNTANDFGVMGDRPSHPELLDYLANEFVENGWRMKPIHRIIVLGSAYRQASENPSGFDAGMATDADNRFLWRAPLRRLTAEEVRDGMLFVAGELNPALGGQSIVLPVDEALVNMLYDPTQWEVTKDPAQHNRRSIYLIAKRNLRLPFMEVFDQPALMTTCSRRETSTHAPQSLELLNGDISNQLAERFAARLRREVGDNPAQQVERAYLLAAARMPTNQESKLALAFLKQQPLEEFALAVFNLNAFLYVN